MSGTTLDVPALRKTAAERATRQAQRAFGGGLRKFFSGYLALVVVSAAVLGYVLARTGIMGTDVRQSALDLVYGYSRPWVALTFGALAAVGLVRVHVATGGSRQSFVLGAWRATATASPVIGLVVTAAFVAERAAYLATGQPWDRLNGPGAGSPGGFLFVLAGETLSTAVYLMVGVGIALVYYRWSFWPATAALVVMLVPAVLAEIGTRTGLVGGQLGVHIGLGSPWQSWVGIGLALSAYHLSWLAAWLVGRGVNLPPHL